MGEEGKIDLVIPSVQRLVKSRFETTFGDIGRQVAGRYMILQEE